MYLETANESAAAKVREARSYGTPLVRPGGGSNVITVGVGHR